MPYPIESKVVDGKKHYRITLDPENTSQDAETLYELVTGPLSRADYNYLTFYCPNGEPFWLASFFGKLDSYGLRASLSPESSNQKTRASLKAAVSDLSVVPW